MSDLPEPKAAVPAPGVLLTAGGLLARNAMWSLVGQAIPMIAAAVAIPILLRALGTEAFGILTISWTLIGYFSLFDFGLGRALTRAVAEGLGDGQVADLPVVVGCALIMLFVFGVVGTLTMTFSTPWLVGGLLRVPSALVAETRATFYLLAVSLPAVLLTAGLGGVLAAYQQFRALNLIRIPMSILSFVLPMAILPYTHSLAAIVGTIVVVRFVGTAAHLVVCVAVMPDLRRGLRWVPRLAGPLLRSGGWLAVINIIVPLFASADRILVGAWTSVASVAYYATPQEIATKAWILPGTLVSVLFPAFAASSRVDPSRVRVLFTRGLSQVYIVLFPATLILIVLGADVLRIWLGTSFEHNAQATLRFMVVGSFCTGLSFIPSALIQAVGQPRMVGWLLIAEVPLFVLGLWWGVHVAGPAGAAFSWSVRALVDLAALMLIAASWIPDGRMLARQLALPAVGTVLAVIGAFALVPLSLALRSVALAVVLVPFGVWALSTGLAKERDALKAGLQRR